MENLTKPTKSIWREWAEALLVAAIAAFIIRTVGFGLYTVPSGSSEPTILVGDKVWANKMVYFFQKPQRGEFIILDNPEFVLDETSFLQRLWQKYIGVSISFLGLKAGPDNWVKRVIAIPGDIIEGRVENGIPVIYLNGKKLSEPYVNPYPLITVHRTKGFIDADQFGSSDILKFVGLQYAVDPHMQVCTYDPNKLFADQPYYKLSEDMVIRNPYNGNLLLVPPHAPKPQDTFEPIKVPQGKYWGMGDSRNNSHDSRWWGFIDESQIHGRASFIILSIDTSESFWLYDLIKHPIDFWTKHVRWDRFLQGLGRYNGRPDLEKD
jgi:signal peptidase I